MTLPSNFKKYINKLNVTYKSIEKIGVDNITENHYLTQRSLNSEHDIHLAYVVNGYLSIQNEFQTVQINKNNYLLFILNKDSYISDYSSDLELMLITLSSINLYEPLSTKASTQQLTAQVDDPESLSVKAYFDLIWSENTQLTQAVQQLLLDALFGKIISEDNLPLLELPHSKVHHEVETVKQHIHVNFATNITLDELANLTGMNKFYLVHIFKRDTGKSPIDYLIHVRVDEAKNLLANSTLPIAKIAQLVGFASQSYFSKMFKRQTQVSPSRFRKEYSGNLEEK